MPHLENNQDKTSHGGPRKGAGRKPGAANQKTREIADKAVQKGITPLEVMLEAMNALRESGDLEKAAGIAKDAAPYIHPKLSSVEMNAKVTTKTLDEELTALNALVPNTAGNS